MEFIQTLLYVSFNVSALAGNLSFIYFFKSQNITKQCLKIKMLPPAGFCCHTRDGDGDGDGIVFCIYYLYMFHVFKICLPVFEPIGEQK